MGRWLDHSVTTEVQAPAEDVWDGVERSGGDAQVDALDRIGENPG